METPPPDGKILFDGTNLDCWRRRADDAPAPWPIDDGDAVTVGGDIRTRETFTDFRLHVEFLCPPTPSAVRGQGRSNSGVFLQGRYEIQVLDSYSIATPTTSDCGALYATAPPRVNACRPPGEWQSYDVTFVAPKDGAPARVSVIHNGIVIHENVPLTRQTGGAIDTDYAAPGPILLQDHGNLVRYRNIWIV